MTRVTRAPGKAMLFGEYAVLEGAPALLAACPPSAPLHVDSSALTADGAGGRKLGLGSSAAVTVAVFGEQRQDLSRIERWRTCRAAHDRAQGHPGSGADIAAALWGGILR